MEIPAFAGMTSVRLRERSEYSPTRRGQTSRETPIFPTLCHGVPRQSDFGGVFAHALDADGGNILHVHAEQGAAFQNVVAVALGGEFLVLELLNEAFYFQIQDAVGAHSCAGLDDSGEFVDGEQALFHVGLGFHLVHDFKTVCQNGAHVFFGNALRKQFLFGVLQVFFGEFLVVVIM